jgi:hypothetical protein
VAAVAAGHDHPDGCSRLPAMGAADVASPPTGPQGLHGVASRPYHRRRARQGPAPFASSLSHRESTRRGAKAYTLPGVSQSVNGAQKAAKTAAYLSSQAHVRAYGPGVGGRMKLIRVTLTRTSTR